MKFLLISMAIIAAVSAQYGGKQTQEEPIAILSQQHDSQPDGPYQYSYETANGIQMSEQGVLGAAGEEGPAINALGQYSFTGDDGVVYSVTYTADENGFHPQGDHLPVAPEVPAPILRALEYIRTHPQPEEQ